MKIISSLVFVVIAFSLAFTILWDLSPYALEPDLIFSKVSGVIDSDTDEFITNIFRDYILPVFSKIGINFVELFEKVSVFFEALTTGIEGFFDSFADFFKRFFGDNGGFAGGR